MQLLLQRHFRKKINTFQRGKIGNSPSFSEPVFLCILQTLEVSIFLPAMAPREEEEEDFSGVVFFPMKCVSRRARKLLKTASSLEEKCIKYAKHMIIKGS